MDIPKEYSADNWEKLATTSSKIILKTKDTETMKRNIQLVHIIYYPRCKYSEYARIFHVKNDYNKRKFREEQENYEKISQIFGGRIVSHGKYYPEEPIIYEMNYLGRDLLEIAESNEEYMPDIINILFTRLPDIIRKLTSRGFVHTDIALRNITITFIRDEVKDKISDAFIHLIDYDAIEQKPLSNQFLAPLMRDFNTLYDGKYAKDALEMINLIYHEYNLV
jgi:hypothetical protein